MQLNEAYIVSSVRTPVGKAGRGALKDVRPEHLGATAVTGAIERIKGLEHARIDDLVIGCAYPEGPQGNNMARAIAQVAKMPDSVPGVTVNRFCSSGVQTIAQAYNSVSMGQADCIVAGGVESMSSVPMGGFYFAPDPELADTDPDFYTSMGTTAENVAERFHVEREAQDAFALQSHQRASEAIAAGRFKDEIIPVHVHEVVYDEEAKSTTTRQFTHDTDEGPRPNTSLEVLAKLRPVFKQGGSVTAGNSSQTNDGAAATVVMSKALVDELEAEPMARMLGFAVAGVAPEIMGIGPMESIPKVLKQVGMTLKDIDLIELNEAFASQSLAILRELEIDQEKVNVNGGAIALGHPLGCTGAKLTATLLHEMKRRGNRYGIVTMCIGGGMGASAVFENLLR
ncbi:acetyl-CoA C-acyltransferase [Rubrivirga sp. F394]|uniref:acetyl-CoA C-acyltransferase n=1 Tax=Rubrivirga litoralis TaxID=3075598 RepID=A0ABU3BSH5_9BACT|nr:acetyl-CoA C-acyltransferase [Rubrivirga sp. F394]MDT0632249.1 acetyl-CoA C-acyltransferase [Rubrivirga sp. F394]